MSYLNIIVAVAHISRDHLHAQLRHSFDTISNQPRNNDERPEQQEELLAWVHESAKLSILLDEIPEGPARLDELPKLPAEADESKETLNPSA